MVDVWLLRSEQLGVVFTIFGKIRRKIDFRPTRAIAFHLQTGPGPEVQSECNT